MKRILSNIFLLILLASGSSFAQALHYPILSTKQLHSASFGELRENHFHSGVDIKTEGEEGRPVVAIADGYVVRVVVSPQGYGRAIYIYHPKIRKISVYAHLLTFSEPIEQYVTEEQRRRRLNKITLFPASEQFRFKRGDVIGLSGNSGMSFGAHLHFELRDASGERLYNVVRQGFMKPVDSYPPQLLRLHRIEVDTVDGVAVERLVRSYDIRRRRGRYSIDGTVAIGKQGYFVIECRDRHNLTINRYGVYRTTLIVDGKKQFERRMDSFTSAESRYCNLIGYYPLLAGANCEVLRLARVGGLPEHLFTHLRNDGCVGADVQERRRVRIEVEDDSRNISIVEFDAVGADVGVGYSRRINERLVKCGESALLSEGDVTVALLKNTLYDAIFAGVEQLDESVDIEGVEVLSKPYRVLSESVPLRQALNIAWSVDVPLHRHRSVALARRNHRGEFRYAGGVCWGRVLTHRTSRAGDYVVVADTVKPTIKPPVCRRSAIWGVMEYRFGVEDNFSGIKRYELYVDGEWQPVEYRPVGRTLIYRIRSERGDTDAKGRFAELYVEDGCGNVRRWRGKLP